MNDNHTAQRQDWLQDMQREQHDDNSGWWWAIACVAMAALVMLASRVGPAIFIAGAR